MTLLDTFRSCWLIATFGCLLFVGGIIVLVKNEGRAVHHAISLNEALEGAISVDPSDELDESYNGRVLHITGPIVIGEPLTEPDYNIQVMAVKLKRRAQMYQWVEETVEHNYGESVASVQSDTRTYYYIKEWRDQLIDSRSFYLQHGHENPRKFPIESSTQVADAVFIGNFELSQSLKEKFSNYVELTSDTRPEDPTIKLHLGIYYHSYDVFNPKIGDVRLLFSFAGQEGELYTIVGKFEKNRIVPFSSSRGVDVLLLYPGEEDLISVSKKEHHSQRLRAWGIRFIGWAAVFFGVTCTSSLLQYILTRVYFLSIFAPDAEHPIAGNLLLSLWIALTIASFAWVAHQPMISFGLFVMATSPFMWFLRSASIFQHIP